MVKQAQRICRWMYSLNKEWSNKLIMVRHNWMNNNLPFDHSGTITTSQLTSHTDSRPPAPSRCLSAESSHRVQIFPAASLWPRFQFCHSRLTGPASPPSPCCLGEGHPCVPWGVGGWAGCISIWAWERRWSRKSFSGFHTFLPCSCSSHRAHCLAWKIAFTWPQVYFFVYLFTSVAALLFQNAII